VNDRYTLEDYTKEVQVEREENLARREPQDTCDDGVGKERFSEKEAHHEVGKENQYLEIGGKVC
jgi:hypothetical protein